MAAAALVLGLAPVQLQGDRPESVVASEHPVTANDLGALRAQNSPQLGMDPTESRFVVAASRLDAPDFGCALHVSGDGGATWTPAEPVPELPEEAESCYAPEVAFAADGSLYYLFVGLAGPGNRPVGVYLTSSEDRGATFSEPRQVLGEGNYQVRMALDPSRGEDGRIHLVWLRATGQPSVGGLPAPPNPIVTAHSDDGGRTFTEPVRLSDPDEQLRAVAPAVAVGADGAVHVVYYDLHGDARDYRGLEGDTWPGTWSVVHRVSHDGGETFQPSAVVDDAVRPLERVMLIFTMPPPALAADEAGNVYTAWHDARNGNSDVFVARSADQGATWNGPVRANDDPSGNGRHQLLPQLAVSPAGRVDAVFYDRRDDTENVRNHLSYTYSADGAATFAPNVRVTSKGSDSRFGQTYPITSAEGQVEFGSRIALLSRAGHLVTAWTDTRNAVAPPHQDVFAATLRPPNTGGELGPWPAATAGLAVALGCGLMAVRAAYPLEASPPRRRQRRLFGTGRALRIGAR